MHDVFGVCSLSSARDLNPEIQNLGESQRSIGNMVLESLAFQQFHDNERPVLLLADVENRADPGVVERRCGACFPAEALQHGAVACKGLRQEFECDGSPQANVLGSVYDPHAAAPKPLEHAIMRKSMAYRIAGITHIQGRSVPLLKWNTESRGQRRCFQEAARRCRPFK